MFSERQQAMLIISTEKKRGPDLNSNRRNTHRQSSSASRRDTDYREYDRDAARRRAGSSGHPSSNGEMNRRKRKNNRNGCIFSLIVVVVLFIFIFVLIASMTSNKKVIAEETATSETEPIETEAPEETEAAITYPAVSGDCATLEIDCEYGCLIDMDTWNIIGLKGSADQKIYPASMTKILTLVTAVENNDDLSETFTMDAEEADYLYEENASVVGYKAGEEVTVKDLLYGAILPSGADATYGLAVHTSGSEAAFAELMNETAAKIGMKNSHFVTCSGLHDDNHYSTPEDMALLLSYAVKDPTCLEVLSAAEYTSSPTEEHPDGIELTSTLFDRMYGDEPGTAIVTAGKTGYTSEAGNCLATYSISTTGKKYIFICGEGATKWKPIFDTINVLKEYAS